MRLSRLRAVLAMTFVFLAMAPKSHAIDRDLHAIFITSEYGVVAGTAVGLLAYPFSQSVRGIFVGTSTGLYLGIVVGFYYIYNRDNPENPMRFGQAVPESIWPTPFASNKIEEPKVDFQYPVLRF